MCYLGKVEPIRRCHQKVYICRRNPRCMECMHWQHSRHIYTPCCILIITLIAFPVQLQTNMYILIQAYLPGVTLPAPLPPPPLSHPCVGSLCTFSLGFCFPVINNMPNVNVDGISTEHLHHFPTQLHAHMV